MIGGECKVPINEIAVQHKHGDERHRAALLSVR